MGEGGPGTGKRPLAGVQLLAGLDPPARGEGYAFRKALVIITPTECLCTGRPWGDREWATSGGRDQHRADRARRRKPATDPDVHDRSHTVRPSNTKRHSFFEGFGFSAFGGGGDFIFIFDRFLYLKVCPSIHFVGNVLVLNR